MRSQNAKKTLEHVEHGTFLYNHALTKMMLGTCLEQIRKSWNILLFLAFFPSFNFVVNDAKLSEVLKNTTNIHHHLILS
jgi:hypothetical protein